MNILAFADLHAQQSSMQELQKKAKSADLIIAAGDLSVFGHHLELVMTFLTTLSKPVLVVHGNHEDEEDIRSLIKGPLHFVHGQCYVHDRTLFIGWGGGGFALVDRVFEQKMHLLLRQCKKYDRTVFITHQPPYGTKLDYIYGHHAGSKSYRDFIVKAKPTLAISGHLHETAKKRDVLGKTLCVNPGHNGLLLTL
ncbi:metallophosphoesterase [Candidatus Woesearchaeota archaeon]|nr:metallophosphoesterase [Candidatus Woesearchaeota archaeon]